MLEVTCSVCAKSFEAKRRDAKFCSPRCRQLARRRKPATPAPAKKAAPKKRATKKAAAPADRGLVGQVVHELMEHDRLDTFHGQLAVQLASEIVGPGATGISGTSKELRAAMALALEGVVPKGGDGPTGEEPEDEVARVRAARDAKRRNATRRA